MPSATTMPCSPMWRPSISSAIRLIASDAVDQLTSWRDARQPSKDLFHGLATSRLSRIHRCSISRDGRRTLLECRGRSNHARIRELRQNTPATVETTQLHLGKRVGLAVQHDQLRRAEGFAHQAVILMVRCREQDMADLMSKHSSECPSKIPFADIWMSGHCNELTTSESLSHCSCGVIIEVNGNPNDPSGVHNGRSKRHRLYGMRRTTPLDDHRDRRDVERASVARSPSQVDVVRLPDR